MHLPILKDQVPYSFEIVIEAEVFEFEVRYNADFDFFTLDALKDGELLVNGEKLVYGVPIFVDVFDDRFPVLQFVPLDESGQESKITFDNIENTVYMQVVE